MSTDQHMNPMTGSDDAVAAYDTAVDDLLAYRPAVLDHLGLFATEYTDVPMCQAMTAYLQLTSTDRRDLRWRHRRRGGAGRAEWQRARAMPISRPFARGQPATGPRPPACWTIC